MPNVGPTNDHCGRDGVIPISKVDINRLPIGGEELYILRRSPSD